VAGHQHEQMDSWSCEGKQIATRRCWYYIFADSWDVFDGFGVHGFSQTEGLK